MRQYRNIGLIVRREVLDQLRDRRTLFAMIVMPLLLYPAMGIGSLQLTMLFSEQPRVIVVLGADELPDPPLLQDSSVREEWLDRPQERQALRVIADLPPSDETAHILASARELVAKLAAAESASASPGTAFKLDQASRQALLKQLDASGIDVVMVIPSGLKHAWQRWRERLLQHDTTPADRWPELMRPKILVNTARDQSLVALQRWRQVWQRWQTACVQQVLQDAQLPQTLPHPFEWQEYNLAAVNEISASLWSKLFPAFMVLMALTGAYHVAIDLGAGEKERGTMETLLICPAARSEIVLGKFITILSFSVVTTWLNLLSLGITGMYMSSLGSRMTQMGSQPLGELTLPGWHELLWVVVLMIPVAGLFSALCLGLSLFARSGREGQLYLSPLLMITVGVTVFCLSPGVEIQPLYSIMPVVGPALLLKGLMLAPQGSSELWLYLVPVLLSSSGYSLLGLWWAIDQFNQEEVLFRESERFDLKSWLRHVFRHKEPVPSASESLLAFVLMLLLQFAAMRSFQQPLLEASAEERPGVMLRLLMIQQLAFVATPVLLMGLILTTNLQRTFACYRPSVSAVIAAVLLAIGCHPWMLEMASRLQRFFPPLPPGVSDVLATLSQEQIPWWLTWLAIAVMPACCEELAFRGFLLSGLSRPGRTARAVVITAGMFGLIHMIPQQVLTASILGLVLGTLVVRSGSLIPAVVFHLLFNSLEVLRHRWGKLIPGDGLWSWWFLQQEGLRYQPLTLLLGMMLLVLGWWFLRKETQESCPQRLTEESIRG
ncbi:MAG: sodium extrusion protein NatB [Planctomycetaceae bacterium]|nr:MAG: sodium extrusion protein NatB [Planctomycetaceae bacterium]